MSLVKIPGQARDLGLRTQHKEKFMKLNLLKSRAFAGVMFLLLSFVPNNLVRLTAVDFSAACLDYSDVSGCL
jgi:hypothetical protein